MFALSSVPALHSPTLLAMEDNENVWASCGICECCLASLRRFGSLTSCLFAAGHPSELNLWRCSACKSIYIELYSGLSFARIDPCSRQIAPPLVADSAGRPTAASAPSSVELPSNTFPPPQSDPALSPLSVARACTPSSPSLAARLSPRSSTPPASPLRTLFTPLTSSISSSQLTRPTFVAERLVDQRRAPPLEEMRTLARGVEGDGRFGCHRLLFGRRARAKVGSRAHSGYRGEPAVEGRARRRPVCLDGVGARDRAKGVVK